MRHAVFFHQIFPYPGCHEAVNGTALPMPDFRTSSLPAIFAVLRSAAGSTGIFASLSGKLSCVPQYAALRCYFNTTLCRDCMAVCSVRDGGDEKAELSFPVHYSGCLPHPHCFHSVPLITTWAELWDGVCRTLPFYAENTCCLPTYK